MSYQLHSLDRALNLIAHLSEVGRATLSELAAAQSLNTSTCLRTLRVLQRQGLVRRWGERHYQLGYRLIEWGERAAQTLDLTRELHPHLTRLSDDLGCTVHLGLLRDGAVTVVDKIEVPSSFVRYSLVGTRMPLHCTSMGKAVLTLYGPAAFDRLNLTDPLPGFTANTITSLAALELEIKRTATRGYAVDQNEHQPGFTCVGTAFIAGPETLAVSASTLHDTEEQVLRKGAILRSWLRGLRHTGLPVSAVLSD